MKFYLKKLRKKKVSESKDKRSESAMMRKFPNDNRGIKRGSEGRSHLAKLP